MQMFLCKKEGYSLRKNKYLLSTIALMNMAAMLPSTVHAAAVNTLNTDVKIIQSVLPKENTKMESITYTDKDYEPIIGKLTCDTLTTEGCACEIVTEPTVTVVSKQSIDISSLTPKELITEGSTAPTAAPTIDLEMNEENIDDQTVSQKVMDAEQFIAVASMEPPASINDQPTITEWSNSIINTSYEADDWVDTSYEETWKEPTWTETSTEEVWTNESAYSIGDSVADAALSLVGSTGMDCYDVVEYALSVAGWSGSYASGTEVSLDQLSRGDIILYPSHYSVYVGNGQAVHGGYNGLNVILGDIVVGKQPYTAYHLG